ncbi:MAG: bifunctional folylpolyglutamate synthase/dihydrofolate synthase [Synergistaceae bacterium]|jgi:dihydrofolate synthase/folylpolyglutamate synthase|nr:bifunctional folylpolyglutamate synthase/dihydrofolate synthase [Synergistaceae bacterium]
MKLTNNREDFDGFESLLSDITRFSSLGIRPGLRRISRLLSLLGNPQDRIRAIQVLGTNGKGSAAATMEALLRGGLKTALYTSPHLISLQERLRVDGKYAPIENWRAAWSKITDIVTGDAELGSDRPSFFEHFTALCLMLMEEARVDIAILEAGMGGRYDATSVCNPAAVMINPIGMDHMQYLGGTIEEIAGEKFAAARNGVPAFYTGDDEHLSSIFVEHCEKIGAIPRLLDSMARPEDIKCGLRGTKFSYITENGGVGNVRGIMELETPLLGPHQAHNASRAITVLLSLKDKFADFAFLTPDSIRESLARTDWPGRMEIFSGGCGPPVMLDGAHNEHAMRALVSSISSMAESGEHIKIGAAVLAIMGDKDIPPILSALRELRCPIYCAGLPMERAARAENLARMARAAGLEVKGYFDDPGEALDAAKRAAKPPELVLCCGSLYLVGFIRKILKYR